MRDLLATPACIESMPSGRAGRAHRDPACPLFPGRVDLLPPSRARGRGAPAPQAAGDAVVFRLSGLERVGAPASSATLARAQARTSCSRSLPGLPFGISLPLRDRPHRRARLAFAGTNATFSALG